MRAQLEAADARMVEENEQPCCYAKSDKYWVTDPTGIAWETFHTLGAISRSTAKIPRCSITANRRSRSRTGGDRMLRSC